MTFHIWFTVLYVVSALPTILLLSRVMKIPTKEAKTSRTYYELCLASVLLWTFFGIVVRNLVPAAAFVASVMTRLTFIVVSLAIFFFVMSSIYFARSPLSLEAVFVASPIIVILLTNLADPFEITWTSYGWVGDISNPVIRFSWLGLVNLVMAYSLLRVYQIRSKIKSQGVRKRLTFFIVGALTALLTGVAAYLVSQLFELPAFSVIAVNFSLLLGYLAFSPSKQHTQASGII